MARYRVAHDIDRTWLCESESGELYWGPYEESKLYRNFKTARAALDMSPNEPRMYGESLHTKARFMKFYDSNEHFEKERKYLENKRLLRDWGH